MIFASPIGQMNIDQNDPSGFSNPIIIKISNPCRVGGSHDSPCKSTNYINNISALRVTKQRNFVNYHKMWGPQDNFPTTTNSGREFLQKEQKNFLGRGNFAAYLGVNEISQAAPDCTDGVFTTEG